ncbi:MAG: biopolymer transporter ExbD [candidate division Zixibacteria bacterium]
MAAVDLGGGRSKKKKGGLKRPKRRVNIRNDLTPMVDIAFLLLIFYMVTTVFSTPLSMEISLPPKQADVTEAKKIGKSKLLQMFVDKNDSLYYMIGEDMDQPEQVNFEKLAEVIDDKNRNVSKLVMVLKIDHAASYQLMVVIIDEIQRIERQINAALDAARKVDPTITSEKYSVRFSLQDMNAWDEHVLKIVSEGGVVEL